MGTKVFDRQKQSYFEEKVFGGAFIDLAYGRSLGRFISGQSPLQRLISKAYGVFQHSRLSKYQVEKFMNDFEIGRAEFQEPLGGYASFADFFVRTLAPGVRNFPSDLKVLGACAEGRLSVFKIESTQSVLQVKGKRNSLSHLIDHENLAQKFVDGWAFVFRLCPVDYHRFHFPDAGVCSESRVVAGLLHSVNPAAQKVIDDVFCQNERQVSLFESENFGPLAFIEVGALCVGKIHQTYKVQTHVQRGDEKGYFDFGGSTTIMLSNHALQPEPDIVKHTAEGVESYVRLGEPIARLQSA